MKQNNKKHMGFWKRILAYCLVLTLAFGSNVTSEFLFGTTTVYAAKKVSLSATSAKLCVGQTKKLSVKNTSGKVTWSVNKPKIATVNKKGKVTALKTGTAKVKAVVGKKTLTCTIKVVKHTYAEASCTKPSTCTRCKKTKGKALGHLANEASCTEDSVCSRCELVLEAAKGHDWVAASCTEPATCSVCKETQGEPIGHDFQPTTCGEPEACSRCNEKSDKITEHIKSENHNPCTEDTVCLRCQVVLEAAKGHDWTEATCTEAKKCKNCGLQEGSPLGHDYVITVIPPSVEHDGYTEEKCKNCGDSRTYDYVQYVISESEVQAILWAQKANYPEGMPWTSANTYTWYAVPGYVMLGSECAAFVFMMSDIAFGTTREARKVTDLSNIENEIRVGDVLHVDNQSHFVIVLDHDAEGITVAEGNYNASVHWGRRITYEELRAGNAYYYTRY